MPRQSQRLHDPLGEARRAVDQLAGSPLEPIAIELNRALEVANSGGEMAGGSLAQVASYVNEIAKYLPKSYGDRFQFDASLIRAVADDWSAERLFSPMIVPCYETQWGYTRLIMPLTECSPKTAENKARVVDLILMPKRDDLSDVRLLDYPWIAHELAHILMFRFDDLLIPLISPAVSSAVSRLRLGGIADRGRARAISQLAQEEFCHFWVPTPDHRNWSHELSADLIAAWVLGPVYLAAFEDVLGHGEKDPYQVSPIHPRYAVRAGALLETARRLHFFGHAKELDTLLKAWESSHWRERKTNRYRSLADSDMISGLIDGASKFCTKLGLRRWSNDQIPLLAAAAEDSAKSVLGTDLLKTAWLAFSRGGQNSYEHWESGTVRAIANSLKP